MKLLSFGFAILAFVWFIEDASSSSLHMVESRKTSNVIMDTNNLSFHAWYKQRRAGAMELKSKEESGNIQN